MELGSYAYRAEEEKSLRNTQAFNPDSICLTAQVQTVPEGAAQPLE